MDHPRRDFIHPSVVVCATTCDSASVEFIPVSRIAGRAAIVKTSFRFDYGEDSVVIAVPLLKRVDI